MVLHQFDVVINAVAYPFHQGADDMPSGVGQRQPEYHAAGLAIPDGHTLTHEVGQDDEAIAAGRHMFRLSGEQVVRVASLLGPLRYFPCAKFVTEPAEQRAG